MKTLLAVASTAALLAIAPAAWAGTYYVDPAGNNANACTSPGAGACLNLAGALGKTRASSDTDTINIAAGTYDAHTTLDQPNDDNLTIVGAGPTQTTIRNLTTTTEVFTVGSPTASPSVEIDDLKIDQEASSGGAVTMWTTTGRLSNVAMVVGNASNSDTAVNLVVGAMTLDRVTLSGSWTGYGVGANPNTSLTVNDSSITLGPNSNGIPVSMNGTGNTDTLNINRSILALPPASGLWALGTINTNTTVDSSLLTGGTTGMLTSTATGNPTAVLRNVTIDTGVAGTSDLGGKAVWAEAPNGGTSMSVTLDSSITLEPQHLDLSPGGASIACTNSDVPDQTETGITCGAGTNGNTSSTPSALFVNAAGGDYHLNTSPLSPAIDTGNSAALAGDESIADLDGNSRVADGDFNCTARRDKGAYEAPPPTASITAPVSALLGDPVAFSGQVSSATADVLTYGWTFSDGGSASGENASYPFTALGQQHAELKVSDPHGCSLTATHDISIAAKPPAPTPQPPQPSPPGPSNVKPRLTGSSRQKLGKFVTVTVACPDGACTLTAAGTLNVPNTAKSYKLRKVTRSLAKGGHATLKLALSSSARKAALKALKRHKKVTASIKVTAAGTAGAATKTVKLHL